MFRVLSRTLLNDVRLARFSYSNTCSHEMDPVVKKLCNDLLGGKRSALAEAITLVENCHPHKKAQSKLLLGEVLQYLRNSKISKGKESFTFRIGISGPPGAGKSTFIESFGKYLIAKGHRIAVLAVDPSSATTGGSILGDKTRMQDLSRDLNAFIRPSPSRGQLGGVTRSTNEAIVLCEAAGYDTIIVETIGVGQSEYSVADMVDLFALLIPPAGGDELQGIKRGIMEISDLIIVNKSDGDLVEAAQRTQYQYISALKYARSRYKNWKTPVKKVSSIKGEGLPELWELMSKFCESMEKSGEFSFKRKLQRKKWLWTHINENIMDSFDKLKQKDLLSQLEKEVMEGVRAPGDAADIIYETFIVELSRI